MAAAQSSRNDSSMAASLKALRDDLDMIVRSLRGDLDLAVSVDGMIRLL